MSVWVVDNSFLADPILWQFSYYSYYRVQYTVAKYALVFSPSVSVYE